MSWGVRGCVVGSAVLGALAVLAGCSGGIFLEREPWRHEAEVQCLGAGTVKEGAGIVRIDPIRGPGMCGADFPFKVSSLGEAMPMAYADDLRPPAAIPGGSASAPPRWPISNSGNVVPAQNAVPGSVPPYEGRRGPPYESGGALDQPISLDPPHVVDRPRPQPENYDFRRPYGATVPAVSPKYRSPPSAGSPREDFSPVPYERRPLVDAQGVGRGIPGGVTRAPLPELSPAPAPRASMREPPASQGLGRHEPPPLVPLGSSHGAEATGSVAPVSVAPPATLACPMVSELDRWIASAVQPAAMRWFGAPVAEIKQISAYSCRGMNGNPRARISEHAFGNALDIAAFTLADGRTITVKGGWNGLPEEQGFLRDVQAAACDQFTTVLAPGSNVYHYDHIHVDLMRRRDGHSACNPHAVSGEEIAARAGAKYAKHEPSVTGSLTARRLSPPPKRLRPNGDDEERRERALPMAQPGDDDEDD